MSVVGGQLVSVKSNSAITEFPTAPGYSIELA
jgi:hypothetical protein